MGKKGKKNDTESVKVSKKKELKGEQKSGNGLHVSIFYLILLKLWKNLDAIFHVSIIIQIWFEEKISA